MIPFQEYLNTEDPIARGKGSVEVTPEDCATLTNYGEAKNVILDFGWGTFKYTTQKPHRLPDYPGEAKKLLYTTDEDGNPKAASVFSLVE